MAHQTITGEIAEIKRISISGGIRPLELTVLVKGLKEIKHSLLGSLIGEKGYIKIYVDKDVTYDLGSKLSPNVPEQFKGRQRMAKNLWVEDINYDILKGKNIEIKIHY